MDFTALMEQNLIGIPLMAYLIFLARICDVSLGTMRIVFISRGYRSAAAILGFFEVSIWIVAVGQVIRNVNTPILMLAYAGGYAAGSYLGILIESKMRLGNVILRIITKTDASQMIEFLHSHHYGVTKVTAEGTEGRVHLIFMVLRRKYLSSVLDIVKEYHPRAFLSIEDVREVQEGNFPVSKMDRILKMVQRK
ncbi:MAG: DUF2179 domain-containing protein [bacterium]|jgi:uncharacterized protein YebE (UPF0316 family)|nr:DUF2179 domain-containing protein [bacterium]